MKNIASQNIIEQFFVSDGQIIDNKVRRSVLLALLDDLNLCVGYPKAWRKFNLSDEQIKTRDTLLPFFASISLYCSGIDLLGKVIKKRKPGSEEVGSFFKECAEKYFVFDKEMAKELWNLRNNMSHMYSLDKKSAVIRLGSKVMEKNSSGEWIFHLRPMRSNLEHGAKKIYEELLKESDEEQNKTIQYISENCFVYLSE